MKMLTYNYIYENLFITSDSELDPLEYPIGTTLDDYKNGMYVQLNEELVSYEKEHMNASPEEVWEMHPIDYVQPILNSENKVFTDFDSNHNFVYVNGQKRSLWNHQLIIYDAECAKVCNQLLFIFLDNEKYFRGPVDTIINIMRQVGFYYYTINLIVNQHYKYLLEHPDQINTYDYTTGYPEVPNFTLEEIYDINLN